MNRTNALLAMVLLVSSVRAAAAEEQAWGDLTGQLIYDGQPPVRKKIDVPYKDYPETFDESLIVDPKTRGLANAIVYLRPPKNTSTPLRIHPDYDEQVKKPVSILVDERGFAPHVSLLHTEQLLRIKQQGKKAGVAIIGKPLGRFQDVIPAQGDENYRFSMPESQPLPIACSVHPWFSAYVLIRDNPYMAITDAQGRFKIKNLPAGEHEFQFWQEKVGFMKLPAMQLRETEVAGKLDKGSVRLAIEPGENNLGIIKLDPKQFQ